MDNSITVNAGGEAVEVYESNIQRIADEYIQLLSDKQRDNMQDLFPDMILYIRDAIGTIPRDIDTLNSVWRSYIRLCARLGRIPTLGLFAMLIGANAATLSDWGNNEYRSKTGHGEAVREWKRQCETFAEYKLANSNIALPNLIFSMKCNYGWIEPQPNGERDQNGRALFSSIPVGETVLEGKQLPRLSGGSGSDD